MSLFAAVLYGLLCLAGVTSCSDEVAPTPSADWRPQTLQLGAERLSVLMPDDGSTIGDGGVTFPDCPDVFSAEVNRREAADLEFVMLGKNCDPPDRPLGNGYRGYFRTVEDVPNPTSVTQVSTPIGPASVVTYDYYECTNSCTTAALTAAIITLDAPADPDHPTLQVRQSLMVSNGDEADVDIAGYVAQIRAG